MAFRPPRIHPGPGQESVWDYPRPPRVEPCNRHLQVVFAGLVIAETRRALRVLETSLPPTYYFPPDDVLLTDCLAPAARSTFCEWKGRASYFTIRVGERTAPSAAWCYPGPPRRYAAIRGHLGFHPARVDACLVDGEPAKPQEGNFYGGWITRHVVGPFKGGPGTLGW